MFILRNVDSSRVDSNRVEFSPPASGAGGMEITQGPEWDTLEGNVYRNLEWAALSIRDSSAHILVYGDSLVETGGISLRPHWSGRSWTPFYVNPGTLPPRVGNDIVLRRVFVDGSTTPLRAVAFQNVVVDSSVFRSPRGWNILAFVTGSQVDFRADTFVCPTTRGCLPFMMRLRRPPITTPWSSGPSRPWNGGMGFPRLSGLPTIP